jgi:hypothetical protein
MVPGWRDPLQNDGSGLARLVPEKRGRRMTRDPRTDPQPGDEVRVDDLIRNVIARDGERVFVHGPRTHYWMRLGRWQKWCEKSWAMVVAKQKG